MVEMFPPFVNRLVLAVPDWVGLHQMAVVTQSRRLVHPLRCFQDSCMLVSQRIGIVPLSVVFPQLRSHRAFSQFRSAD